MNRLNISVLWLFISFPSLSYSDTALESAYGKWVRITPSELTKPVSEYPLPRSPAGSVTNEYKRNSQGQIVVHGFQNPIPAPFVKPPVR